MEITRITYINTISSGIINIIHKGRYQDLISKVLKKFKKKDRDSIKVEVIKIDESECE